MSIQFRIAQTFLKQIIHKERMPAVKLKQHSVSHDQSHCATLGLTLLCTDSQAGPRIYLSFFPCFFVCDLQMAMSLAGALGVDVQSIIMGGFQNSSSTLQTPRRLPGTPATNSEQRSSGPSGGRVLAESPEPTPPAEGKEKGRGRGRGRHGRGQSGGGQSARQGKGRGQGRGRGRGLGGQAFAGSTCWVVSSQSLFPSCSNNEW